MFNPFGNAHLDHLTKADLQLLVANEVAEGYAVEYKRDFPENKKIARSIASFANTHGGWYIVGVTDDGKNVAASVDGYQTAHNPDPISRIREVVKSHISPTPLLHAQVVQIGDGRAVLVIKVPGEQDTPFITLDGRVYRRVMDSSDPVSENDRHTLDMLFARSEAKREQFLAFCQEDRGMPLANGGGWVGLYLRPYPLDPMGIHAVRFLDHDFLDDMLKRATSKVKVMDGTFDSDGSIRFNTIQMSSRSVLAKVVQYGESVSDQVAMEFFADGSARIHLSAPYQYPDYQRGILGACGEVMDALDSIRLPRGELPNFTYFDVGHLSIQLILCLGLYEGWIKDVTNAEQVDVAGRIVDLGGVVPFADSPGWGEHVLKYGLPVVNGDDLWVGRSSGRGFRTKVASDSQGVSTVQWFVASQVMSMCGFPVLAFARMFGDTAIRFASEAGLQQDDPDTIPDSSSR